MYMHESILEQDNMCRPKALSLVGFVYNALYRYIYTYVYIVQFYMVVILHAMLSFSVLREIAARTEIT